MVKSIINSILSSPDVFNIVRRIAAGNQKNTKEFIQLNIQKYYVTSVLDIGCGTGDFVESVPSEICYSGIDVNRRFVQFAKEKYKAMNRRFYIEDATNKSFYKNKTFDAVLLISMLHHLSDEDIKILFPIIKCVAKKIVIVADIIPNPPGVLRKLLVKLDQGKHIRTTSEKTKLLKKYFNVVTKKTILSHLAIQYGIVCEV